MLFKFKSFNKISSMLFTLLFPISCIFSFLLPEKLSMLRFVSYILSERINLIDPIVMSIVPKRLD